MSGLFFVSGFSEGMQSDNFTAELQARGATQPTPAYPRLRRQRGGRRPDRQGQALVLHERPRAGFAAEHPERLLQPERGQRRTPGPTCRISASPAFYDRTWENYTPRITWQATHAQQVLVLVGRAAGLPQVHGHGVVQRLAGRRPTSPEADGHGEFSPQRVQTARWTSPVTNRLLLEAGFGTTYYQWARHASSTRTRRAIWCACVEHRAGHRAGRRHRHGDLPLAELVEQQDQRHELDRGGLVRDRFAQHQGRLPGQLLAGRPRDAHQHQSLQYTFLAGGPELASRSTRTRTT